MSNKIEPCSVQTINLSHLVSPSHQITEAWKFPNIKEWRQQKTTSLTKPKRVKLSYFQRFCKLTKFGVFCVAVQFAHAQGVWSSSDQTEAIYYRINAAVKHGIEHKEEMTLDNVYSSLMTYSVSHWDKLYSKYSTYKETCNEYIQNTINNVYEFFGNEPKDV